MRAREVGWITFLAGLPLAPLLFHNLSRWTQLDPWQSHEVWAMGWTGVLCALSLWSGTKPTVANQPLALWLLWTILSAWWIFTDITLAMKQYPFQLLLPLLFAMSILAFYHAATQMWDVHFLNILLRWMAWSSVVVMAYCLLQLAGLDQFFKDVDTHRQSRLVGTIGNPTHLASYLAFTLPLLLLQAKHWAWKVAVGVNLLILCLTNSIGGQLAAVTALIWWCGWLNRRVLIWVGVGLMLAGVYVFWHWQSVFNPYGRWQAWIIFWSIFRNMPGAHPITGLGLGFVYNAISAVKDPDSPIYQWHHVHNEYLQIAIEQGVIGLGLVGYAAFEVGRRFIRLPKTPLLVVCTAILLAASVNAMTIFPLHLWMLSSIILTAYAGVYVIAQETVWPPRAR